METFFNIFGIVFLVLFFGSIVAFLAASIFIFGVWKKLFRMHPLFQRGKKRRTEHRDMMDEIDAYEDYENENE